MAGTLFKCHICFELKPHKEFNFFPCGHGFCATPCIDGLFYYRTSRTSTLCPNCRCKLRREDARPIYLEFASSQEEQAAAMESLVHDLSQIDKDTKATSLEAMEKNLGKFSATHGANATPLPLFQVVQEFQTRITPIFKKAEEQSREIEALKRQLENSQVELASSLRRIGPLEHERDKARDALQVTIIERDTAIELADQAAQKTTQMRQDLERAKMQESSLEESRALYRSQILEHQAMARKQNEKIKSYKQRLAIAEKEAENLQKTWQEVDLDCHTPRPPKRSRANPSEQPLSPVTNMGSALFEAMPRPRFRSDWNLNAYSKKPKIPDASKHGLPLKLDQRGHPVGTVQIGTRNKIHVTSR